jgi:hypothetical protein
LVSEKAASFAKMFLGKILRNTSHGKDAAVNHLNAWGLDSATDTFRVQEAQRLVDAVLVRARQPLIDAVTFFIEKPISPLTLMAFEITLLGIVRELGRQLLELVVNALEPDCPDKLPKNLSFECGGYRRRNQKTANRSVASRFGDLVLHRYGYRSWQVGDGSIFPFEMLLGLNHSATPGLVDWIGRHIATAGSNQAAVIELLRTDCGVTMGVKRLRPCLQQLSESMEPFRQEHQVDVLLEALQKASSSSGSRKPVLAVGRDGITLRALRPQCFPSCHHRHRERLRSSRQTLDHGVLGSSPGTGASHYGSDAYQLAHRIVGTLPRTASPFGLRHRFRQ